MLTSWKKDPIILSLFFLTLLMNSLYLGSVPGLLGDEASEGENVYQILDTKQITFQGERSYIGPLIDYVRIPFVLMFGYSILALRLPMLLITALAFCLAVPVFRRLFGELATPYALAALFLSPIYLSYQRLGWAITLFPFCALLLLWLIMKPQQSNRALFIGLVAGLGIHNHILFLPTALAILLCAGLVWSVSELKRGFPHMLRSLSVKSWPLIIGLVAALSTQLVVLNLYPEDQGDPEAVAELMTERLAALPQVMPLVLSGSSFTAAYTGQEFSPRLVAGLTLGLLVLAGVGLVRGLQKRTLASLWALGIIVQLILLMYIIDRFSLRYLVIPVFAIWILAGVGLAELISFLPAALSPIKKFSALLLAVALSAWFIAALLLPFVKTGGSVADFSLGVRTDSAAALVDIRPLIACLVGAGPVFSENVHIDNRLRFLAHDTTGLIVAPEVSEADWLVEYRTDGQHTGAEERCLDLTHFRVIRTIKR